MADLLPYGRQENREDSPDGYPQERTYAHGPCTTPIPRAVRAQRHGDRGRAPGRRLGGAGCAQRSCSTRRRATRDRAALAAERRRRRERFDKYYRFAGPDGEVSLLDLDSIVDDTWWSTTSARGVLGDPARRCGRSRPGRPLAHLTSVKSRCACVSSLRSKSSDVLEPMGWDIPGTRRPKRLNAGLRPHEIGEMFGLWFIREGNEIYRCSPPTAASRRSPTWTFLDLNLGARGSRRTPRGYPQTGRMIVAICTSSTRPAPRI